MRKRARSQTALREAYFECMKGGSIRKGKDDDDGDDVDGFIDLQKGRVFCVGEKRKKGKGRVT